MNCSTWRSVVWWEFFMRLLPQISAASALLLLTNCGSRIPSEYPVHAPPVGEIEEGSSEYPSLPMTPGTVVFRTLLLSNPFSKNVVFWGNYGGPGNFGGAPVDAMDVLFLEHDLVYVKKESFRVLRESDHQLVDKLEQLDPSLLDEPGQKFRKKAIFYMRSPLGTIGKLIGTINNSPPPTGLLSQTQARTKESP